MQRPSMEVGPLRRLLHVQSLRFSLLVTKLHRILEISVPVTSNQAFSSSRSRSVYTKPTLPSLLWASAPICCLCWFEQASSWRLFLHRESCYQRTVSAIDFFCYVGNTISSSELYSPFFFFFLVNCGNSVPLSWPWSVCSDLNFGSENFYRFKLGFGLKLRSLNTGSILACQLYIII